MSWMYLADRLGTGFGQKGPQDLHRGLHGVGGEEDLGDEQNAVSEVDADDAHALDQGVVQDAIGAPVAAEQDVGALDEFVGEAVVQVVVHLRSEIFVVEIGEDDLFAFVTVFVFSHVLSPSVDWGSIEIFSPTPKCLAFLRVRLVGVVAALGVGTERIGSFRPFAAA